MKNATNKVGCVNVDDIFEKESIECNVLPPTVDEKNTQSSENDAMEQEQIKSVDSSPIVEDNNAMSLSVDNGINVSSYCKDTNEIEQEQNALAKEHSTESRASTSETNIQLGHIPQERNRYKRYGLQQYNKFIRNQLNSDQTDDVKLSFELQETKKSGREAKAGIASSTSVSSTTIQDYDQNDSPSTTVNNAEVNQRLKFIKKRLSKTRQVLQ